MERQAAKGRGRAPKGGSHDERVSAFGLNALIAAQLGAGVFGEDRDGEANGDADAYTDKDLIGVPANEEVGDEGRDETEGEEPPEPRDSSHHDGASWREWERNVKGGPLAQQERPGDLPRASVRMIVAVY